MFQLIVITQEKTIKNIEGFDKSSLKHADTQERNVLPDKSGSRTDFRVSRFSFCSFL